MEKCSNHLMQIYGERLRSLLEDGYVVQVKSDQPRLKYTALRHRSNGNRIRLYCYPVEGVIKQMTNCIMTYHYIEPA